MAGAGTPGYPGGWFSVLIKRWGRGSPGRNRWPEIPPLREGVGKGAIGLPAPGGILACIRPEFPDPVAWRQMDLMLATNAAGYGCHYRRFGPVQLPGLTAPPVNLLTPAPVRMG